MSTNVLFLNNLLPSDFDIGNRTQSQIGLRGDLLVSVTQDTTAKTVTFKFLDPTEFPDVVVSMSAYDIYVDDLDTAYDITSNVLTLKQSNGGSDVVIDLNDLQKSAVTDGLGTAFSGDGSDADPLKVDVVVDPLSNSALSVSGTGIKLDGASLLDVDVQDAFGVHQYYAASNR